MRLLTLNCACWQQENPQQSLHDLVEALFEEKYDLIALQEVAQLHNSKVVQKNPTGLAIREDNWGFLLKEALRQRGLNYSFIWLFNHFGYDIYEEGVAILSLKEPINWHARRLSQTDNPRNYKKRDALGIDLTLNSGRLLRVFSCHLGFWGDPEENYIAQVDRLIGPDLSKNSQRICLYLGDFNNDAYLSDEGYSYIKRFLYDLDSFAESTAYTVTQKINGWQDSKHKRIDFVFSQVPFKHQSYLRFTGTDYPLVSDHLGVEVRIDHLSRYF